MSVRGSKNKILLYVAGAFSIAIVILLYHNASQRLEDMEKSYERCHMNEESLSAQLQVILEYKMRLEKSLQQEKSDHAQSKEELQNKLEEERQNRERENLESINKFTALQQQYKLLQSQHEDVKQDNSQLKKLRLTDLEDKSHLETQIQSLKDELKLMKDRKENDLELWKSKYSESKKEKDLSAAENKKLVMNLETLEKENEKLKSEMGQLKTNDKAPITYSRNKPDVEDGVELGKKPSLDSPTLTMRKSSTAANKHERELFPSGNNPNTSTPMINPEALQSQEKSMPVLPVPQPRQEISSKKEPEEIKIAKENVAAKPDETLRHDPSQNEMEGNGAILRLPGFVNQFDHVPEIQKYKERLKQGEKNDNGGEVGDEEEPIKNLNEFHHWRDGDVEGQPFVRHHVPPNKMPRNQGYHYPADYDGRKEEDDDDDVDQIDNVENPNEKNINVEKPKQMENFRLKSPVDDERDSVMIHPK